MSTLTLNTAMTMAQLIKALGPDNKALPLIDTMRRREAIVEDMPFIRANMPDKHRISVRDGTSNPKFVGLGDFASQSTIGRRQVDEYLGMIEDYSQLDDRYTELTDEAIAERDRVDRLKIGDVMAKFSFTIFYGDRANDVKEFDGIASRANKVNDPFSSYDNKRPLCVSAGGSANRTSLYLVEWGENRARGAYAANGTFGCKTEDLKRLPVYNATGASSGIMMAYTTRVRMTGGLVVEDPRSIARIANIDSTNADPWTNYALKKKLNALRVAMNPSGPVYVYAHPALFAATQDYLQDKSNIQYKVDEIGKEYFDFMGFRWRVSEQIANTELAVS